MSASLIGRFGVKHFQTVHHCNVDVTRGLALLSESALGPSIMGSEDEAEQSLARPRRQATAGPSGHANSPHPSSREGHLSTAGWNSDFLLSDLILYGFMQLLQLVSGPAELSSVNPDAVHDHGQPAGQRTIAFFIPRRLAICIAQALSQDHFFERIML